MRRDMFAAAEQGADAVEFRLDLLARLPDIHSLSAALADAPVKTIVTCRPVRQGGRYEGPEADRLALLAGAATAGADFIDVEDDVPPADRPAGRVILSYHNFTSRPDDLHQHLKQMDASTAAVNKVAFAAAGPEDAIAAGAAIAAANKPTLALAMGEHGLLSRLAARRFGAFGTFAALAGGAESAPGQPTLGQVRQLYRWDRQGDQTELFGVIGCPIAHSMSPAIHNAALAAADYDGLYVPLLVDPKRGDFFRFLDAIVENPQLSWRGLSVTIPHKQHALEYVGAANCDELAVQIGAVNTITFQPDGSLRGDNTDYAAALDSLCQAMEITRQDLAGRSVTVLGAGGVARAVVAALRHYRADVTICNRTIRRAEMLAEEFNCRAAALRSAPVDSEIIINCTSVGMHPATDACCIDRIGPEVAIVFDTIYNPVRTKLLRLAEKTGAATLTGVDMFVAQGAAQFETWTGQSAPRDVMRQVILEHLPG